MKMINLNLYEFDELSKEVQQKVIEKERWNIMGQCMDCYGSEYKASLEAFEKLTNTNACNWYVDYCGYGFNFKCNDNSPVFECPVDNEKDVYADELCGKLLFRYIENNIIPYITKGKYFSKGKYIDGKYNCKYKYSRVIFDYRDNCPLTGTSYDYSLIQPIVDYYESWCSYPANFSLTDLIGQCYDGFFKSWHEDYEYWADNEDAICEELRYNQYEDRLYYEDGDVYVGPLNEIA